MVKIRLQRTGRRNRACYRLVVTDARVKRQGEYIERVGHYDPLIEKEDEKVVFDAERVKHWVERGAQATEAVVKLLRKRGLDLEPPVGKGKKQKKTKTVAGTAGS